jgi:hypothetical protein
MMLMAAGVGTLLCSERVALTTTGSTRTTSAAHR